MPLVRNEINHLNKNLFINTKIPNVPRPSFVWNYFGYLYKKPTIALDSQRVYCKVCFNKIKEESPDESFSSVQKKVANYGATSSTGNMKCHLLAAHQIEEIQATKVTERHVLSMFSQHQTTTKASQLKEQLGHQLILMCCRDLLPFSIVENEGRNVRKCFI